jgi:DNA repair protein RadD
MELRPYQREAVESVYAYLRAYDDNPCVVIPTGGGKTPVIATICRDAVSQWGGRVLILAHVKELLEQATDKLARICPEVRFGVYSAGLGRRETQAPVIVAGIQSVYKRACELDPFDLVIVDEAHMIPPEGDGMYRQFLRDAQVVNPSLRVIGLTATPFRLKSGHIVGADQILSRICFEVGVRELIVGGYLCPLVTKAGINKADTSRVHVRGGEFVANELEDVMDEPHLVEAACGETVGYTGDRRAVLIFASGVRHGEHIVRTLAAKHGLECGFVTGETPAIQRDAVLARFRRGELKYLCNVNVLTTGFDAPHIDCVALVRPTMSPGLYYQMVGRGFRQHPGKHDCLVLDFGGNVVRHGPVDQIKVVERNGNGNGPAPAKECPECLSVVAAGYARCPDCGYEFPAPERQMHEPKASDAGILSGQVTTTVYQVRDTYYSVHVKRGAAEDAPRTLRVDYQVGWHEYKSEWVCFEHDGYARQKAVAWWRKRSPDPVPSSAERAVEIAQGGGLAPTKSITVRSVDGDPYERVVDCVLGPIPEPVDVPSDTPLDDDIPF